MIKRRKTKTIKIGSVKIGTGHPISIQSMTKTDTQDVSATVRQIKALEKVGCEIIRVAVKNMAGASTLDKIKARINIPLVADIHFNYRLGLEAIARGVDGLRLNPGNIYRRQGLAEIAKAAKKKKIPIRVGVNSGSLPSAPRNDGCSLPIYRQKRERLADAMVKSALDYIRMLAGLDFYDIIVSLKASDVTATVSAYKRMADLCNYPFHLGITACGLAESGAVKSALGIGSLLLAGIGDTIRVSLTASPQEEVKVAKEILQSLGLRYFGPEIIACPTCGRTQVDLVKIVKDVSRKLDDVRCTIYPPTPRLPPSPRLRRTGRRAGDVRPPKVAIMGCEVNGPGEAGDADVGVACGKNSAVLFKQGRIVKRIQEKQVADTLLMEIKNALV